MEDENILLDFDPNDFLIRLNPVTDENGEWNGDVAIGVITTPDNDLDEEDFDGMMYLTMMVTASLPLMEDSVEFRTKLQHYVKKLHGDDKDVTPKPTSEKIADNVIKLKF